MLLHAAPSSGALGALGDVSRVALGELQAKCLSMSQQTMRCRSRHSHCEPTRCHPPVPAPGTRVLLPVVIGLVLHQPALALFLQQCAMMALVSNNAGYCSSPLLVAPLMQQRLERVWGWLGTTPLAVLPFAATKEADDGGKCGGRSSRAMVCVHFSKIVWP